MTFEHVIPQSLGGACAPDKFKTHRVCGTCNSNLGLFVDASFEKSWFVTNWLQACAMACYDPKNPSSVPLVCLGNSDLQLPGMQDDEICETYLGPLGETVFWVRPHDERLFWYSGGNPRTVKTVPSRAYFFFSERSAKSPLIPWLSFRDAFSGRKVRKVFGTVVHGANPADIGFVDADPLDKARLEYLTSDPERLTSQKVKQSFHLEYDCRFLAKLARGIGFCLFGEKVLFGNYAAEVRKGLWHRADEDIPALKGSGTFSIKDEKLTNIVGLENAVTLLISNTPLGVALNINIGKNLSAVVLCVERACLDQKDYDVIGDGLVLVLFPPLKKSVMLSLPEYVAHKIATKRHPELDAIEGAIGQNRGYFKSL